MTVTRTRYEVVEILKLVNNQLEYIRVYSTTKEEEARRVFDEYSKTTNVVLQQITTTDLGRKGPKGK